MNFSNVGICTEVGKKNCYRRNHHDLEENMVWENAGNSFGKDEKNNLVDIYKYHLP